MPAKVFGDTSKLHPQPGKQIVLSDRTVMELSYKGPYALCIAQRPARGSTWADAPGLIVDQATVIKLAGGMGELRIACSTDSENDSGGNPKNPTYEFYSTEETWSIKRHPRYNTGGANAITRDVDWTLIREWEAADTQAKQDAALAKFDTEASALNAKKLIAKLRIGRESFRFYLPIAVITSLHIANGSAKVCGKKISGKPFSLCPDGYEWLRTGDRWTRTGSRGKWQRTQTFNGYESIDPDLYLSES